MTEPILKIENVTMKFGGLTAIEDLSFDLYPGEFLGLMGPNGAGKTTLINLITGVYKPTAGRILFKGTDMATLQPYDICKVGIARTFQIPRPFGKLTALENVLVSARYARGLDFLHANQEALASLELVGLSDFKSKRAEDFQFAELRKLELARAVVSGPEVLLIDEIAAGLTDAELPFMLEILDEIRKRGIAVILIEHILKIMVNAVSRIVVTDQGKKIAEGTPDEIMKNQLVYEAYLGKPKTVKENV